MADRTIIEMPPSDPAALEEQREALTAFSLEQCKALILTATDQKVRLGALSELNKVLALGAYRAMPSVRNKQVNNFLRAPSAPSALSQRLDAAVAARTADEVAADAAAEQARLLDALEDDDD